MSLIIVLHLFIMSYLPRSTIMKRMVKMKGERDEDDQVAVWCLPERKTVQH